MSTKGAAGFTARRGWVGNYAVREFGAAGDVPALVGVREESPGRMCLVDGERHYIEVNPASCRALGISRSELLRLRVDDLTPPAWRPVMNTTWAEFLEAGYHSSTNGDGREVDAYLGVTYFWIANVL